MEVRTLSRTTQNIIPAAIPAAALVIAMSVVTGASGDSAARILVTPSETEVYVDGHRAGTADDFDGFSQRLRVSPGEHLIELYLDGHKPVSQTVRFTAGETYRIRHEMEPLPAGEAAPPRPTPRALEGGLPPQTPAAFDALGRPIAGGGNPSGLPGTRIVRARVHDRKSPSLPFEWKSVMAEWTTATGTRRQPMRWYGEYLWRADWPADIPADAKHRVCATDAAGNLACLAP